MSALQIVECPRDAMQGWPHHLPTAQKLQYLQQLLQVGFHTLDCLSFVSPKAIPQMADSHEVARQLDKGNSNTQVLAIVANERGATEALQHRVVDALGYPFSISPTFQQRNANSSLAESWQRVLRIQELVKQQSRQLVVYLSMAFGNPYGDDYSAELVMEWAD
ncbi:MAG: hydroxymethylglutaryl-CoA lyase, partial [Chitinophagaceae bacterium]|nr:hydroxymethylglutaryl-CoA lyase [Chitinophagaceae bacterium]